VSLKNDWNCFSGFEVDHIVPVYKGGSVFDESNLQVLCVYCHRKKTNKDVKHRKRNSESRVNGQKKIEEVN
jgi:5-methylcytosine-specific restriction endonuclease McrA